MKIFKTLLAVVAILSLIGLESCSKKSTIFNLASPANRSANVPLNQVFTCTEGLDVKFYSFYFNDLTDPAGNVTAVNLVTNSYSPALRAGHTYQWSAKATLTSNGDQTSETWSFTTQP